MKETLKRPKGSWYRCHCFCLENPWCF
jgi:hypothetical protein